VQTLATFICKPVASHQGCIEFIINVSGCRRVEIKAYQLRRTSRPFDGRIISPK